MPSKIRVLIVSSRQMFAKLLATVVHAQDQLAVVATTESDKIFIDLDADQFDVALIECPAEDSVPQTTEFLRRFATLAPRVKMIALCDDRIPERVVAIFRSGAKGFFSPQNSQIELLYKCIERVHEGQIWANSEELAWVLDELQSDDLELTPIRIFDTTGASLLTHRQGEVVRLILGGLSNRDIAQTLGLSEHTIKNYLFRIYDKLGVSTRSELLLYAIAIQDNAKG